MTLSQRAASVGRNANRLHKAERRRQLLAHAKQLFVSHGYHCTTTEKIARAAGVTEPILYRHFTNKKALFLEVLQDIRQATLNRWEAEIDRLTDPLSQLHAVVELYLGSTREQALELRIMHRTLIEVKDRDIHHFLRSFYLDSEKLLTRIIHDGQVRGLFRDEIDPRVAAWELIRSAMGFSLTAPLEVPLYSEENYLAQALEFLMVGLMQEEKRRAPAPRAGKASGTRTDLQAGL